MPVLDIIRLVTFIVTSVFAVIVLALSADLISLEESAFGAYSVFAAMGIATGLLTLLTLPAFAVIDAMRNGAFTSMIAVEFATVSLLWILWLSTASLTANANGGGCIFVLGVSPCQEVDAIEAFSFLNFFALMGYAFVLLVFALIAHNRGHNVWTSSVKKTNFFAPAVDAPATTGGVPPETAQYPYPPSSAPPPQQLYTPSPQTYSPPQSYTPPQQTFSPGPQYGVQPGYPNYQGSPLPGSPQV